MIFNELYRNGMTLYLLPDEPRVDYEAVRRTVLYIIRQTVENGDSPYEQAYYSEVRNLWDGAWTYRPEDAEAWSDNDLQLELAEWVMHTQEIQELLDMCSGQVPERPQDDPDFSENKEDYEEKGEMELSQFLEGITQVDYD